MRATRWKAAMLKPSASNRSARARIATISSSVSDRFARLGSGTSVPCRSPVDAEHPVQALGVGDVGHHRGHPVHPDRGSPPLDQSVVALPPPECPRDPRVGPIEQLVEPVVERHSQAALRVLLPFRCQQPSDRPQRHDHVDATGIEVRDDAVPRRFARVREALAAEDDTRLGRPRISASRRSQCPMSGVARSSAKDIRTVTARTALEDGGSSLRRARPAKGRLRGRPRTRLGGTSFPSWEARCAGGGSRPGKARCAAARSRRP